MPARRWRRTFRWNLTDSDLSGNVAAGNGPGNVIEVDGSGTGGNVGFRRWWGRPSRAYRLRNTLQVNGGTTLTVQPGVTLYFESGSVMNVYGDWMPSARAASRSRSPA